MSIRRMIARILMRVAFVLDPFDPTVPAPVATPEPPPGPGPQTRLALQLAEELKAMNAGNNLFGSGPRPGSA